MRFPSPLRGIENKREVLAWGMYDFANQSFTLLIITLLFSLFYKEVVVAQPILEGLARDAGVAADVVAAYLDGRHAAIDPAELTRLDAMADQARRSGDRTWSLVVGISLLLVVIASPALGAAADAKQWRKEILMGTGVFCVALTCSLALLEPGWVLLGALLFIPANFCYQLGENFLASFLPDVSTQRNIGRVSAIGWTMGYAGALGLLICVALGAKAFGLSSVADWRPFFVFAGLWFLVGMAPAAVVLRERKRDVEVRGNLFKEAVLRVSDTLRHVRHYRQLAVFLSAFFIYAFGVQTVINFASIIASDFGIREQRLILFVLQLTVTAGVAAIVTSHFQDRIGARVTIIIYLLIWIVSTAGLVGISYLPSKPEWAFWAVGNGIGFGLGGVGTASRSMVGRFTPKHRSAEFFGLWGMTYKLAGAVGVLSFGLVKSGLGDIAALVLLTGFFVGGLVILLFVNEQRGVRAARRAEREHAAAYPSP